MLVGLGVLATVLVPRLVVNRDDAREMLAERLESLSDRPIFIDGDISFSLLPRTRLVADDVRMDGGDGLRIDRIIADLDPADALMGKATISRLVLVRPEYRAPDDTPLAAGADGSRLPPRNSSIRDLAHRFLQRFEGLQILEIREGVMRPRGGNGGSGFSNVNVTVTQASAGSDMRLAGSLIWNGQPADFRLTLDSPAKLIAGASSGVLFDLQSPPLTTAFTGQLSLSQNAAVAGQFQLSTPSLARGLEWLVDPAQRVPDLGPITVDGNLRYAGTQASIRNADISIAGSDGVGALEADFNGAVPSVGGTLAFTSLDLDPFTHTIAPLPKGTYDFDRPIDIGFARTVKLDMRVSAATADLGGVPVSNMAAVLSVGDGRAKIDVGDVGIFGGRAQASLALDRRARPPTITGRVELANVQSDALFSALDVDAVSVSGRSNVWSDISAPLSTWGEIMRRADVKVRFESDAGSIDGFDPRVFAEPGVRPLVAGASGSTLPFRTLEATLVGHGTDIALETMRLANASGVLSATGKLSALDREISLRGMFEGRSGAQEPPAPSRPIFFVMDGEWPNPSVTTSK